MRLARANIDVTLLDLGSELDKRARATHYSPPASLELKKAGIIEDVCERGFIPGGINWKRLDMTQIAAIPAMPEEMRSWETGLVCLPLNQLGQLLIEHLERYPSAKILWSHEVISIEQNDKEATVIVKTPEGERNFRRIMSLVVMERVARSGGVYSGIGTFQDSPGKNRSWQPTYAVSSAS